MNQSIIELAEKAKQQDSESDQQDAKSKPTDSSSESGDEDDIPPHLKIVPTNKAAKILDRKPQTLRVWACYQNGPINPVRVNGRLGWRVSDLVKVLEIGG